MVDWVPRTIWDTRLVVVHNYSSSATGGGGRKENRGWGGTLPAAWRKTLLCVCLYPSPGRKNLQHPTPPPAPVCMGENGSHLY